MKAKVVSYSEYEAKKAPFDWNAFFKKKDYTLAELTIAHKLSSSWVTCACGNQCITIKRYPNGCPIDPLLNELGCEFNVCIDGMRTAKNSPENLNYCKKKGIETLKKIEKRSLILIKKEILKKKKRVG